MADVEVDVAAAGVPKKRTFKKFSFRGVDLDALLDMSTDELEFLIDRFQRGLKRKPMALIKKLRKAKREAPAGEKPELVKTHLRNMIIVPEMIGSVIGVYNGKTFNQIEIKPEMIGHYLAEFSISYKPVKHGRPGIGATHSSRFVVLSSNSTMADVEVDVAAAGVPKKRTFKKFSFRGVDLDALLDMSTDELVKLFTARARRRFQRGLKRKPMALIKKLRKAKREAPAGEKPELVKTHLRNMIIVPEMIGSVIGVYNGKTFNQIEIKPEMIGHYLAEFSISYKPVKHGRPGIGATHSSRFIPLK
ncbi:Ribosomal protein S19A/S15e [Cynara cardunculus var. scolymus]|uniref:Ribosomal protein S19A/S15e n=2 Tax=Cardueae TaxID=102818 RepID=A0A103XDJ0_CYNCS|nr:Ribosomal protein S19A/S15e [Cynara cardunculus var. scolymus]